MIEGRDEYMIWYPSILPDNVSHESEACRVVLTESDLPAVIELAFP